MYSHVVVDAHVLDMFSTEETKCLHVASFVAALQFKKWGHCTLCIFVGKTLESKFSELQKRTRLYSVREQNEIKENNAFRD